MRVENMTSPRSGRPVANQFEIYDGRYTYMQSYKTIIAKWDMSKCIIVLDPKHDCSRTTAKYRNQFLGMTSKAVKAAIAKGEIKIKELNSK